MKLRRLLFFLMPIAFLAIIVIGCSDDDNELSATYRLVNKQGEVKDVFSYGDEMTFELIVTNSSNHTIKFNDVRELYKTAFQVFTSDGNYVNSAVLYDEFIMRALTLKPNEDFHMRMTWQQEPLPKGDYYSPLIIQLNEKTVINQRIKFKIQ